MGVVDPERPHPLLDPEADHPEQRVPEGGPRLRREVDRVDVLVLLGRVLRVLDRPVRPLVEPLGVLAHPRVVGRALDGEVEGDLEARALRALHETTKAVQGAELGVHRGVAALRRADGPRAARIAGPGRERVVRALARGVTDRMDGRQVDDVESHPADVREPLDAIVEGAVTPGYPALRAREHLVPRREGGLGTVHHHLELAVVTGEVGSRRDAGHDLTQVGVQQDVEASVLGGRAREPLERAAERGPVGPGEGLRAADHRGALQQLAREVGLAARDAPAHLLHPRAEGVGPGLDGVAVAGVGLEAEHAAPAVVVDRLQGRLPPGRLVVGAVADSRGQQIVALLEDVRGDREDVAHDALGRVPAVVHRGTHVLDDDGAPLGLHRQRSTR